MKIISWNLWSDNPNQAQNLERLLADFDPDVVCLQEVNLATLAWINSQDGYNSISAIDYYSKKMGDNAEHYLVILSKSRILNLEGINKFSVRHITRNSIWEILNQWIESVEYQFADIELEGRNYRIFNVHLEVASGPKVRFAQFKETVYRFNREKDAQNIVAGDFNIYAKWYVSIFIGWLLGFRLLEYYINERKVFRKIWARNGLKNVFENKITYKKFKLQLDHILVPIERKVEKNKVIEDGYGSDHQPIYLKLKG
jgi:endonuclease/exonuclease/phosphatase family metal-dependent hydrolase